QPVLSGRRRRAGVHLLPRPPRPAGPRGARALLPRPLPGLPRRAPLLPAARRAAAAPAGRQLHGVPHAAFAERRYRPHGRRRPPLPPPAGGGRGPRRPPAAPAAERDPRGKLL